MSVPANVTTRAARTARRMTRARASTIAAALAKAESKRAKAAGATKLQVWDVYHVRFQFHRRRLGFPEPCGCDLCRNRRPDVFDNEVHRLTMQPCPN